MKAYEIKSNTKVLIIDENVKQPFNSIIVKKGDVITILNIDGMYCNCLDENNNRIYIASWTKVKK